MLVIFRNQLVKHADWGYDVDWDKYLSQSGRFPGQGYPLSWDEGNLSQHGLRTMSRRRIWFINAFNGVRYVARTLLISNSG